MKPCFSTPCAFGGNVWAATFGTAAEPDPVVDTVVEYPNDIRGHMLTGSYDDILSAEISDTCDAAVVLLGNCGGEDTFVYALQKKLGCPLTGGAAAVDPVTGESGLVMGKGQAAVFILSDDRYEAAVVSENIHKDILGEYDIEMEDFRTFRKINGQDPLCWYDGQRRKLGLSLQDFEHLTFSDRLGVNIHMSVREGKLVSGRDLCSTMILRYADPYMVDRRIHQFYAEETALIFGCAGLKGILGQPVPQNRSGLFMFGEVCTIKGKSCFGNLMLSKLCLKEKF